MEFIVELLHNEVFVSAALGWLIAQIAKTIIYMIINRQFKAERLVGSGGMPSCHSATVCGLAVSTAIHCGPATAECAIAVMLAIIVMYDAMGVRRETGIQARVLNEMIEMFTKMGKQMTVEEKLKEFVGHTPLQVIVGAFLGIAIAIAVCNIM
ncbi:MAG: divergent PAP2 family protein [Lachnospiraceae bacterium]|nr:divergent PAP2 family protein [Lachnospiraceae bacterium]